MNASIFIFLRCLLSGLGSVVMLFSFHLIAQPLPLSDPQAHGFSPIRIEKLHSTIQKQVDNGEFAGAISMIVHKGEIVDWHTFGSRDLEAHLPMERDTIVRIYSMSKPITTVAVMMLFEEGRFKLDDPIGKYIPKLKNMKVFKGGSAEKPDLQEIKSPITIKQLLIHTSGLTYDFGSSPVEQIYKKADLWNAPNFQEFINRTSTLPLAHQPGEVWTYGISTDVLGYLVEVVSGQDLAGFLRQRLFVPLGMLDTDFYVPTDKRFRLAKIYEYGSDGKLHLAKPTLNSYPEPGKGFPSGGAGLYSTIGDYARFAQMLLNGGRLGDIQILRRKTVEMMMHNHLNDLALPTIAVNSGDGFGFGGAVRIDLAKSNGLGSLGQFGWSGAATTYFSIDPHEQTVALLVLQHFPFDQYDILHKFSTLFYQSIVK